MFVTGCTVARGLAVCRALGSNKLVVRNGPLTENAPWPSSWTSLEALTARFDRLGYQVDGRLRPRVEGAG
eukprot:scaffold5748_cov49-Phaeocystis_antarctica.AAC.3